MCFPLYGLSASHYTALRSRDSGFMNHNNRSIAFTNGNLEDTGSTDTSIGAAGSLAVPVIEENLGFHRCQIEECEETFCSCCFWLDGGTGGSMQEVRTPTSAQQCI